MATQALTAFFHQLKLDPSWMIQVFLVVLATLFIHTFIGVLYRRVQPRLTDSQAMWDDALIEAVSKPLRIIIWVVGVSFAAKIMAQIDPGVTLFKAIDPLRDVAIISLVVWFLVRFISRLQHKLLVHKKSKLDKTTLNAISQILRVSVIVTGVLIGLQNLGYSISGLLALGGAGTIVVGLAAKDMLANFFGGLMVYLDRPFEIGDWIRSPDRNVEGVVEHIGWRLTRIRTFENRPLYVPNGIFSNIAVENPSRMTNRRIYTKIGLRYDDAPKMASILKAVEAMLRMHPGIDTEQTLRVSFIEFGDSALIFMIYAFTKATDWVKFQTVQQEVFLNTIDIIAAHAAQCAFPTTTVSVPDVIKVKYDDSSNHP